MLITTQAIPHPWGVTAFGAAVLDAAPDEATPSFATTSQASQPAEAFKAIHDAGAAIRRVLAAAGLGDAAVRTSRVRLESKVEYRAGQAHHLGYRAWLSFRARTRRLDDVEVLVTNLVDAGANQIDGVEFGSSRTPELRAEARAAAVVAARKKAALYVNAAGARLGALLHLEDVNPDSLTGSGHGSQGIDLGAHTEGGDVLRTGGITISAAVYAGFAILP